MPVMAIYRADIGLDDFARYRQSVPVADVPPGAISHHYGRAADGSLRVVDIWESRERLEAFDQRVLKPALETLGLPYSEPEVIDLETLAIVGRVEAYERMPAEA